MFMYVYRCTGKVLAGTYCYLCHKFSCYMISDRCPCTIKLPNDAHTTCMCAFKISDKVYSLPKRMKIMAKARM